VSDALCRGCQGQIRWVQTEAGKAMPVDLATTTTIEDRVVLYGDDGKRVTGPPGSSRTGHVAHFATCPVRAQFKRQSGTRAST
jgi:hypothetical protein